MKIEIVMWVTLAVLITFLIANIPAVNIEKSRKCRDASGVPFYLNGQILCLHKELFQELPE
jgi:hypothetical protein